MVSSVHEIIGKSKMDAILYESREEIAQKARVLMQEIHDRYGTGILMSAVSIHSSC